ncbi:MAG: hypothetical protein EXR45_08100 [Chloroflexi bacterium]|nr:hypothetical protein [Chloroflexota bacterium]
MGSSTHRPSASGPRLSRSRATGKQSSLPAAGLAVATILVILIAIAFRVPRLADTPGWDGDEAYNLDIAWHLARGEAQMFALDYRFAAHPPLFYVITGAAMHVFGRDLAVIRTVAVIGSSLTAGTITWALARSGQLRAGLLGGLALAVAPFAVAYGRLGYTYVLTGLLAALCLHATLAWRRTGNPARIRDAVILASLGWLSDQSGVALIAFVAYEVRLGTGSWGHALRVVVAASLPTFIVVTGLFLADPESTATEWQQIFTRLNANTDPALGTARDQLVTLLGGAGSGVATATLTGIRIVTNIGHLLQASWWWPAAFIGVFATPEKGGRATVLRLFALLALPAFAIRPVDPYFRAALPLLGLGGWGLGIVLDRAIGTAFDLCGATIGRGAWGPRFGASVLASVLLLPLGLEAVHTIGALTAPAGLVLPITPWLARDLSDARAAAAWVNARVRPRDVVITSPAVTWLINDADVADFLQSVIVTVPGASLGFYPPGIPASRWRFRPAADQARFVILDDVTDAWIKADPDVRRILEPISTMPIAFQQGRYRVHARPA